MERFIQTADKVGLKVIVRTGPFVCAEWENGGLPSWLLKKKYNMRFRCNTEPYLTQLKEWFAVLLPKIRPYLDNNGGPVIALAVENEYGSFGDDFEYLKTVENIYREHNMDCLYIAADGNKRYHLSTGTSGNHIIHGMDLGGPADAESLKIIDEFDPDSPYFATEYWSGNFTNWSWDECGVVPDDYTKTAVNNFVDMGASFNLYMVFGGTNFGFTNGAQGDLSWMKDSYNPCVTSYDYDAAISEWCGYTQRYFDIKEAMERDHGPSDVKPPKSPKLCNIGDVKLTKSAKFFDNMHIGKKYKSVTIETMEEYDQIGGYILYSKTLTYDAELNIIKIIGLHDRAHVFVNGELIAIRMRGRDESVIEYPRFFKAGDKIDILVENMGRINYGEDTYFGDRKGIDGAVVLTWKKGDEVRCPGKITFNWETTCFELDNIDQLNYSDGISDDTPVFLKGSFKAAEKQSCFVHFDNFRKGVIYVNGFNLGRYWEEGPLKALYIPGEILRTDENNEIVVFETDGLKGDPVVSINDVCGYENHHKEIYVD